MRSLVVAADAQSGAAAGDSVDGPLRPQTAGRKGDPQWHAGDDPPFEEACEGNVAVAPMRATGLRRSEDLLLGAETW
jgi:hypothetical protein